MVAARFVVCFGAGQGLIDAAEVLFVLRVDHGDTGQQSVVPLKPLHRHRKYPQDHHRVPLRTVQTLQTRLTYFHSGSADTHGIRPPTPQIRCDLFAKPAGVGILPQTAGDGDRFREQ